MLAAAVVLTAATVPSSPVQAEPAEVTAALAERTTDVASRSMIRPQVGPVAPVVAVQGPPAPPVLTAEAKAAPVVKKPRPSVHKSTRPAQKRVVSRTPRVVYRGSGRFGAAVAYAYAQIGSRYAHGAAGGGVFDCSGLTMRAYARAGLRLPHSSGGQAALAHAIPRSQARPGDLVVGPGHVGIYVGGGYMIDAGNPRVGVSKRRLYGGLSIRRF